MIEQGRQVKEILDYRCRRDRPGRALVPCTRMTDSPHESSLLRLADLVAFFEIRFDLVIPRQRGTVFRLEGLSPFPFEELLRKSPVVPDFILAEHPLDDGVPVFGKLCEHRLQVVT